MPKSILKSSAWIASCQIPAHSVEECEKMKPTNQFLCVDLVIPSQGQGNRKWFENGRAEAGHQDGNKSTFRPQVGYLARPEPSRTFLHTHRQNTRTVCVSNHSLYTFTLNASECSPSHWSSASEWFTRKLESGQFPPLFFKLLRQTELKVIRARGEKIEKWSQTQNSKI